MAPRRLPTALLLLTLLTGCAGEEGREAPSGPGSVQAGTTPAPLSPSADPTDTAWVQLMIPMDTGAVALLDLAAHRALGPRLRSWAAGLRAAQTSELAALRGLRDRMGLPGTDVHEGHDMPGMVTAHDLAGARAAEGTAFDRLLVTLIHEHLEHSMRVSRSEIAAGGGAAAREQARALVTARGEQLAGLTALRDRDH
ncbi:DUF305 domain-containing protein [Streptomyces argenteolus]|uniref:DUF305 domain-containing protein n=1 Tax=Streptomyces argenteolus TaxID=67274 RepID=A0ABW6XB79_9ACTN